MGARCRPGAGTLRRHLRSVVRQARATRWSGRRGDRAAASGCSAPGRAHAGAPWCALSVAAADLVGAALVLRRRSARPRRAAPAGAALRWRDRRRDGGERRARRDDPLRRLRGGPLRLRGILVDHGDTLPHSPAPRDDGERRPVATWAEETRRTRPSARRRAGLLVAEIEAWRPERLYSSPLRRARDVAQPGGGVARNRPCRSTIVSTNSISARPKG